MYIGLDLGTSELKALLLDEAHRIVATAGAALTVQQPQPLWREQDPADWWAACGQVMDRLAHEHPQALARVRGIGLSGQMHGAVLLDAQQRVLRPAILWNDGRSAAECVLLERRAPQLHVVAGNLAMPGFTAPKLLWVAAHEPGLFARTARVLLPKDWLRLALSGECIGEMSDAAGTLWLDVARRRWDAGLLAACGLNEAQMPVLVEGSHPGGMLKPELARRWGLPEGVQLAGGGGDNAASAVGMGVVQPGQGFVSLGTSGVVFLAGSGFAPNPAQAVHAFCHALPGRWHQMSVMLSAASALRWLTQLLGQPDEATLLTQAERLDAARRSTAPVFLPYLNGERTPHNNPQAQGVFFGLHAGHGPADLAWSVLEGVGFGLADGWQALQSGGGTAGVRALSLVGGGARSALWAQLLASQLGVALHTHRGGEAGGALGAARLAWLADLHRQGVDGAEALARVCPAPPVARTFEPDPAEQARLAPRQARFRALYGALAPHFGA